MHSPFKGPIWSLDLNDMDTSGMTAPEEIPSKGSAAGLSGAMQKCFCRNGIWTLGAAIGGVIGGAAGIMGNKKAEKAEQKAHRNYYRQNTRPSNKCIRVRRLNGNLLMPLQ